MRVGKVDHPYDRDRCDHLRILGSVTRVQDGVLASGYQVAGHDQPGAVAELRGVVYGHPVGAVYDQVGGEYYLHVPDIATELECRRLGVLCHTHVLEVVVVNIQIATVIVLVDDHIETTVVSDDAVPCEGELYYRGINIEKLTQGFLSDKRFGFEETTYLLLFGKLPDKKELEEFKGILAAQRSLPRNFVRDVIMKAPSRDMMNTLSRSVLTLYSYDADPENIELSNVLRQCINLISVFPMLSVYGYQAHRHYNQGKSLYIHNPEKHLSTAENILLMLRPDKKYTPFEATILDLALVLHMEHGGGNNSTFTTHVVSSSFRQTA